MLKARRAKQEGEIKLEIPNAGSGYQFLELVKKRVRAVLSKSESKLTTGDAT